MCGPRKLKFVDKKNVVEYLRHLLSIYQSLSKSNRQRESKSGRLTLGLGELCNLIESELVSCDCFHPSQERWAGWSLVYRVVEWNSLLNVSLRSKFSWQRRMPFESAVSNSPKLENQTLPPLGFPDDGLHVRPRVGLESCWFQFSFVILFLKRCVVLYSIWWTSLLFLCLSGFLIVWWNMIVNRARITLKFSHPPVEWQVRGSTLSLCVVVCVCYSVFPFHSSTTTTSIKDGHLCFGARYNFHAASIFVSIVYTSNWFSRFTKHPVQTGLLENCRAQHIYITTVLSLVNESYV